MSARAYQSIFDWGLIHGDEVSPEDVMRAAAVAARLLHLITRGVRDYRDDVGDCHHNDEILEATSAYLECLTSCFLPRDEEPEASEPEPAPGPAASVRRLRAVKPAADSGA